MKKLLIQVAICLIASTCFSASISDVRGSIYWPHHGDRVKKTHYEYVSLPIDTAVWDFSHASGAGKSHEMHWMNLGDTLLVCLELGTQSIYQLQGDSLFWNGYENALFGVHDSIAPVGALTALITCSNISTPLYFHGSYSDNHAVDMAGHHDVRLVRTGTLILPNDTLDNILCVRAVKDCHIRLSRYLDDNPINEDLDSLIHEVETIDRWYSPYHRYPIAENIKRCYYSGSELLKENAMTYMCCPDEQEYALGRLTDPEIQMRTAPSKSSNTNQGALGTDRSLADRVTIMHKGETIEVTVNGTEGCSVIVSLLLCDINGRVWRSHNGNIHDGYWRCETSTASLSPGYYLLHIMNGNEKHVERIRINR